MGTVRARRWPAVAMAGVFAAVLWAVVMAGPGFAAASAVPATAAYGVAATQWHPELSVIDAAPATSANATQIKGTHQGAAAVAHPKTAPKGSPLGVQLATIAVLLALGVGYFKVMTRTHRRAPARKPE